MVKAQKAVQVMEANEVEVVMNEKKEIMSDKERVAQVVTGLAELEDKLTRVRQFSAMIAAAAEFSDSGIPRNEDKRTQKKYNKLVDLLFFMDESFEDEVQAALDEVDELRMEMWTLQDSIGR